MRNANFIGKSRKFLSIYAARYRCADKGMRYFKKISATRRRSFSDHSNSVDIIIVHSFYILGLTKKIDTRYYCLNRFIINIIQHYYCVEQVKRSQSVESIAEIRGTLLSVLFSCMYAYNHFFFLLFS